MSARVPRSLFDISSSEQTPKNIQEEDQISVEETKS